MGKTPRLPLQRLRRLPLLQFLAVQAGVGAVRILAALPGRWIPRLGDALGDVLSVLDRRGRRVALGNLKAAFPDGLTPIRARAIYRASSRSSLRSLLLLLHLQPLTRERYVRWVDVPENLDRAQQLQRLVQGGGVLVSGHFGNWELLLGLRVLFPHLPKTVFLAEAVPHEAINELLTRLRAHGDLIGALRRGGARAVARTVREGGIAALLVDRNVRRELGGIYVPFLGLPARTTPLPGWIYARMGAPVHPIFCIPAQDGRFRIWVGPDLTQGIAREPAEAAELEVLRRINAVIESLVRAAPEAYHWSLKRYKARPTEALGDYPDYSRYDPDRGDPAASAAPLGPPGS